MLHLRPILIATIFCVVSFNLVVMGAYYKINDEVCSDIKLVNDGANNFEKCQECCKEKDYQHVVTTSYKSNNGILEPPPTFCVCKRLDIPTRPSVRF